jgi:hypothetical protein
LRVQKYVRGLIPLALIIGAVFFSACETGTDSNESSIPFPAPLSVQVTAKNESLLLQWTKIAPAQGIIPKYRVFYSTGTNADAAAEWEVVTPGSSNLVTSTITGLANNTPYYVWIKAVYGDLGESGFSPIEYGTPIPPPATPEGLSVTAGETMLEVTWTETEFAAEYEVYYQAAGSGLTPPSDGAQMKTVPAPGTVIHNLTNGTNYRVWVRASNTAGKSPAYASDTRSPEAAASAPSTAPDKPEVMAGAGKLTLVWNQVEGVPDYKLYYGTTDTFSEATAVTDLVPSDAPTVRAEINALHDGTPYYVWVQSWNSKSTNGNNNAVSPSASGQPKAKPAISFSNLQFELGQAAAEYVFAQDLPDSVFFPGGTSGTDRLTRVQETALGDLFTDAASWYIRKKYPAENIDFVFLNGGYIDNYLPRGKVTVGGLASMVKPDSRTDKLFLVTLTGARLKELFAEAAYVVHTGRGGSGTGEFGIVSKEARYTLQYYTLPANTSGINNEDYYHGFIKGGTLKINGEDIVDSRNYRICTTDYIASGVTYTTLFQYGQNKTPINTPFWHGVAEYIYDQGTITPYLDGRIKLEGGVPLPPPWVPGTFPKP